MVPETCSPDRRCTSTIGMKKSRRRSSGGGENLDAFVGSWDEIRFAWRPHVFIEENRVGLGRPVTESVSILKTYWTRSKNKLQKEAAGL